MAASNNTTSKQLPLFDDNLIAYNVVHIPLSKTGKHAGKYETIVDPVDADLADWWWAIINTHQSKHGHAIHSKGGNKNKRRFWMHRVIMGRILNRPLGRNEVVDHINGNGLDNRRCNLRLATVGQNNMNKGPGSNNTSGQKGVYWRPDKNSWSAEIVANGNKVRLGYFKNFDNACAAYREAAREMHGEFAWQEERE
jgi:hypothetical protein